MGEIPTCWRWWIGEVLQELWIHEFRFEFEVLKMKRNGERAEGDKSRACTEN
jgi:hypothetical protein